MGIKIKITNIGSIEKLILNTDLSTKLIANIIRTKRSTILIFPPKGIIHAA